MLDFVSVVEISVPDMHLYISLVQFMDSQVQPLRPVALVVSLMVNRSFYLIVNRLIDATDWPEISVTRLKSGLIRFDREE